MGLFFDDPKPRVTQKEWREKIRSRLVDRGLEKKEVDYVEGIFHGDMEESDPKHIGIQAEEIERGIVWLKSNRQSHTLNDNQIVIVEEELRKFL